jgi:hypothetical protein
VVEGTLINPTIVRRTVKEVVEAGERIFEIVKREREWRSVVVVNKAVISCRSE